MLGAYIDVIYAITADDPWGPWSEEVEIYRHGPKRMRGDIIYASNVQMALRDREEEKWVPLTYRDSNALPIVNVMSFSWCGSRKGRLLTRVV
jgi:hypothetical protein